MCDSYEYYEFKLIIILKRDFKCDVVMKVKLIFEL